MKVQEFIDLVNSSNFEEFSDIPENLVKFVDSRCDVKFSLDETYITSMNVYECDDGFVGCRGVSHYTTGFDKRNVIYIKAKRVKIELKPVFVEVDDSGTGGCWFNMECCQTDE